MSHYYNEHDPKAAAWLRELMKAGEIPTGDVDERSITDVRADELVGYVQCHFFAGIGGWPLALRLAGWDVARPIWTGSCPCPPFSAAGKKKRCPECGGARPVPCPCRTGFFICTVCEHAWHADDRHLWPEFRRLIRIGKPPTVTGEQVAGADGRIWFAGVRATLERDAYAVGAADLAAAGVNSPHIRQRIFWLADASRGGFGIDGGASWRTGHADERGAAGRLGDPIVARLERLAGNVDGRRESGRLVTESDGPTSATGATCGVGDADGAGSLSRTDTAATTGHGCSTLANGGAFWSAFDLIPCRDGKARRVEPGTFPLAYGVPARVVRLRGYGNAIVPQVAAAFIRAYLEAESELVGPQGSDDR